MQFELDEVPKKGVQDMEEFRGEFNRAKQDIFRFVTDVNRFSQQVAKLGTARDTVDLRKKLNNLLGELTDRAHKIGSSLIDLKNFSRNAGPSERHEVNKLIAETQDQLQRFKAVQQEYKRGQERSLPATEGETVSQPPSNETGQQMIPLQTQEQLQQQQQQEQIQDESDPLLAGQIWSQQALIEERDQGIQEINIQIAEVNDIFQDLAKLVVEQGDQVDSIDNNIVGVSTSVERGREELVTAQKHQKNATKRMWCMFCTATIILVVILIAVLTANF
eukprot:TRINITY_DN28749_c1_g1_i2.p1 TRINITY_DN28749_c1_g1~~TRINITY_DN28749_c1_g1_i2.p1  ORF type:complete len:276 (-),score=29.04 TRINITY_DN28749_c1_g1_i2:267-1094(-)